MGIGSFGRAAALAVLAVPLLAGGRPPGGDGAAQAFEIVACQSLGPPVVPGAPARVLVKQKLLRGLPVGGARVEFISASPGAPAPLRTFQTPYLFNDMLFEGEGLLITEWAGADRPVAVAFHIVSGGADMVFDRGARGGFEYWHDVILRTNAAIGADGNYHNTSTELWQWNGRQYKLVATVPYGQRLGALAKLEHEAKRK